MKKFFLGGVVLAALATAGSVRAADMPVKAPIYTPVFSWTGLYVGGEIGGRWLDSTWTATSLRDPVVPPAVITLPGPDASSPRGYNLSAARVGGYAGYNWQTHSWVYGLEFDVGSASRSVTAIGFPGCTISCVSLFGVPLTAPSGGGDLTSVSMGWDASARGRLGYLVMPNLLLYGTGGVAWQRIETMGACGPIVTSVYCINGVNLAPITQSTIRTGWTIGGGLEWNVYGNWLVRGEYRYADFGTLHGVFPFPIAPNGINNIYRYDLSVRTQIATFGLAYKF